jgi:hypothetical protein
VKEIPGITGRSEAYLQGRFTASQNDGARGMP